LNHTKNILSLTGLVKHDEDVAKVSGMNRQNEVKKGRRYKAGSSPAAGQKDTLTEHGPVDTEKNPDNSQTDK